MSEFIEIISSFPTIIFSGLLVLMSLYWGLVILGALDLDLFDVDFEVDFDIDFEGELDVEIDLDGDVEGSGMPIWASILSFMGVGKVPVMIVGSAFSLAAFVFSYLIVALLGPYLPLAGVFGVLVSLLAMLLAYPATAAVMHPLKEVFRVERVSGGASLIGQACIVTTGKVSESFGQAKIDGGAGLLLSIRSERPNDLKRGAEALIVDFDEEKNMYWVESLEALAAPKLLEAEREKRSLA